MPNEKKMSRKETKNKIKPTILNNKKYILQDNQKLGKEKSTQHQNPKEENYNLKNITEYSTKYLNPTKEIFVPNAISIEQLSALLQIPKNKIIKSLLIKGIPTTPNQLINKNIIQHIEDEYTIRISIEPKTIIDIQTLKSIPNKTEIQRPPIVAIIGHVNHGKTTLLNKIQNNQRTIKEIGGITQKINAYEVSYEYKGKNRKITFLDTPGHETFSNTRTQSLLNSDLAILVIAIDDEIKAQTIEAIKQAKNTNTPLIVAINKIDKINTTNTKIEYLKKELQKYDILTKEWGGQTQIIPISALQGTGIAELLNNILSLADTLNLCADPSCPAKGTILETSISNAHGITTSILIKEGTLKLGDTIVVKNNWSKVKHMSDVLGNTLHDATPSSVITIQGSLAIESMGENFLSFTDTKDAIEYIKVGRNNKYCHKNVPLLRVDFNTEQKNKTQINLIIKSESQGLIEAITLNLPISENPNVNLRVIKASIGCVTETDVELAVTSNSEILAFNTTYAPGAKKLASSKNVSIKDFKVIYDVLDYIKLLQSDNRNIKEDNTPTGTGVVKAIFSTKKTFVAGVLVTKGKITKKSLIHILQGTNITYKGEIKSLKRGKEDILEAQSGSECGIGLINFAAWKIGDLIYAFNYTS